MTPPYRKGLQNTFNAPEMASPPPADSARQQAQRRHPPTRAARLRPIDKHLWVLAAPAPRHALPFFVGVCYSHAARPASPAAARARPRSCSRARSAGVLGLCPRRARGHALGGPRVLGARDRRLGSSGLRRARSARARRQSRGFWARRLGLRRRPRSPPPTRSSPCTWRPGKPRSAARPSPVGAAATTSAPCRGCARAPAAETRRDAIEKPTDVVSGAAASVPRPSSCPLIVRYPSRRSPPLPRSRPASSSRPAKAFALDPP